MTKKRVMFQVNSGLKPHADKNSSKKESAGSGLRTCWDYIIRHVHGTFSGHSSHLNKMRSSGVTAKVTCPEVCSFEHVCRVTEGDRVRRRGAEPSV